MNNDATEAALGLLGLSPNNLPPLSPNPLKRKQSSTSLSASQLQIDDTSAESISCICGFTYDDGFSIACDDCFKWSHAACFDIAYGTVPEEWRCWECMPRPVDRERAIKLQKSRQKQVQERRDGERNRRRASPGMDKKHRRASAASIEGGHHKRKRRLSISLLPQPTEDEHVDIDEPWTNGYVHITRDIIPHQETRDKLLRQAQHWRGVTALSPSSPFDTIPERLSNTSTPQTAVQQLPDSSFSHPILSSNTNPLVRPPSFALHTTAPIPSSHFITPYTSTIIPSSTYLADPLNAYAHLGMPKPFVHLMGTPLDIALDSRITGDKSRFVRSGCRPNAVLRPILCSHSRSDYDSFGETLSFGVFATRDLKANEEVVLGWEWDDGNAVHSLPALIETPHIFPRGRHRMYQYNSSNQVEHLRNQMSNILHALSSTFTTCACGSKAKDCALTQMAAFVDGCSDTSNGADLGPLVGVKRGFKTREKVPFSGGMSGVEMCDGEGADVERSVTLPVLTFSPASPMKYRNKGKGRATAVDEHESEMDSPLASEHEESGFKSSEQKHLRQRITINTSQPNQSYSSLNPNPPPRREEFQTMDVEDDEAKMPPKMRKRWIHRSAEALKDLQAGGFDSPVGSVVSLGSAVSGGIGLGIKMDDSGGGSRSGESDRMEVDDPKQMPPPPMPAALDPTTISSVGSRSHSRNSQHDLQSNSVSTSPSTSFAKLSLLSPIVPATSSLATSITRNFSTLSPHQSRTPLQHDGLLESAPMKDVNIREEAPIPCERGESSHPRETSPHIEPKLRSASPDSAASPVLLEQHTLFRFPPNDVQAIQQPTEGSLHPQTEAPAVTNSSPSFPPTAPFDKHPEEPQALQAIVAPPTTPPVDHKPPRSTPTSPIAVLTRLPPPPPPPPPPAPKVKLSLKDFALRKKKQREEMAKLQTSPSNTQSAPKAVSPPRLKEDVETVSEEVNGVDGVHFTTRVPLTPEDQTGSILDEPLRSEPQTYLTDHFSDIENSTKHSPNLPLPAPCVTHSWSPSPQLLNGSHDVNPSQVSYQAKVELLEHPLSNGIPAVVDEEREHSCSPLESSPPALNGSAKTENLKNISPSSTPPTSHSHHRQISQEDGEIPSTISDSPPSQKQKPHHLTPFAPRSHTPPTQPRSFHAAPASPSMSTPSPAPVSAPRHPSQKSFRSATTTQLQQGGAIPVSRPLPSGPRALRAGNLIPHGQQSAHPLPNRSFSSHIPRGPSADRERMEWDRERAWPRSRGRGVGNGAGTGWAR